MSAVQATEPDAGTKKVELTTVTLSTPDPRKLARFYGRLIGWELGSDDPTWATLRNPSDGGIGLAFHLDEVYVPPVWPSTKEAPQMQAHLEIWVEDLEAASMHAADCGAVAAEFQPQENVRVHLDPDGHPFCLWT